MSGKAFSGAMLIVVLAKFERYPLNVSSEIYSLLVLRMVPVPAMGTLGRNLNFAISHRRGGKSTSRRLIAELHFCRAGDGVSVFQVDSDGISRR